MTQTKLLERHYATDGILTRLDKTLLDAGLTGEKIDWDKLTPIDQFHSRGLPATKELAEALGITSGKTVLDVGSGFGGPARYLAAALGCRVTGIELTEVYVEIANRLTEKTGLSNQITFVAGDALAMPFEDESFDYAWSQHVSMNIANKHRLYEGVYRVLKAEGKFGMYDIVKGNDVPLVYPVPWASEATISHLVSPDEMVTTLREVGFLDISLVDRTDLTLGWFQQMQGSQPGTSFSIGNIIGSGTQQMLSNLAQNIKQGSARVVQIVAQKNR
ncbi:MAG: class I SAM-dependent methyltransferase [Cyanobacteria bacterium SZAS TMP-1]|nr:class I SAM-dependent methyltransferase [Cyanobacteria bacterium SZAS TMP-1]